MNKTKKLVMAGLFIALAVAGSTLSIPVLGSKCSPVQHLVNIVSAVALGPVYSVAIAFIASVLRIAMGLGTFMAFPGSMCGALLAGLLYKRFEKMPLAVIGELFGTSILGGLLAYPVSAYLLGNETAALFSYIIPFLISSAGGALISIFVLLAFSKTGLLKTIQKKD